MLGPGNAGAPVRQAALQGGLPDGTARVERSYDRHRNRCLVANRRGRHFRAAGSKAPPHRRIGALPGRRSQLSLPGLRLRKSHVTTTARCLPARRVPKFDIASRVAPDYGCVLVCVHREQERGGSCDAAALRSLAVDGRLVRLRGREVRSRNARQRRTNRLRSLRHRGCHRDVDPREDSRLLAAAHGRRPDLFGRGHPRVRVPVAQVGFVLHHQ